MSTLFPRVSALSFLGLVGCSCGQPVGPDFGSAGIMTDLSSAPAKSVQPPEHLVIWTQKVGQASSDTERYLLLSAVEERILRSDETLYHHSNMKQIREPAYARACEESRVAVTPKSLPEWWVAYPARQGEAQAALQALEQNRSVLAQVYNDVMDRLDYPFTEPGSLPSGETKLLTKSFARR